MAKYYGRLFFVLFFVSIAHLKNVYSIDFELCEQGDITSKDGSIFLDTSVLKSAVGKNIACQRLIHLDEGRVKITINKSDAFHQGNNRFEVFNGGFGAPKLKSTGPKGQETYESTGNTMGISLKVEKPEKDNVFLHFRGTFRSVPFQTTCECTGIQNGIERCTESFGKKKCDFFCLDGFEDLTGSTGNLTCDLLDGKWDKKPKFGFSCQTVVSPSVVVQVNITLKNSSCISAKENISTFFRNYFKADQTISAKGLCFGEKGGNCTIINCVNNDNVSFVAFTMRDKSITYSTVNQEASTFKDLFKAYKAISSDEIKVKLLAFMNGKGNVSTLFNYPVIHSSQRQCPTGMFIFLNTSTISHPVCSKCPQGSFYKTFTCEKCPNGTSSAEGSVSCSPTEKLKTTAASKATCKIYCIPGKGLNLKTGFCQWCPYNTYQNRTDVPNANCTACPDGQKTRYPGATGENQCYVPCKHGTFFSSMAQKCQSCPLGTYQDAVDHLYTDCKHCGDGKVTYTNGSADQVECVPSCTKGHHFDSKTSDCSKCPVGSYQDNINQLQCTLCPVGTSSINNGSTQDIDCIKTCQTGTYFDAQNSSCSECPIGTYRGKNDHLLQSCEKCAEKKTTYARGAVNDTQCLDKCDVGQYFNVQKSSCTQCPLGTYMDQSERLLPSCTKCADKKTTHAEGSVSEALCLEKCSVGQFYNSMISSCVACPKGFYQNEADRRSCIPCPPGQTTKNIEETSRFACVRICETFPCENGAECIEEADAFCKCPRRLSGKRCEVIEKKEDLLKFEMSVRFTSLKWSQEMNNKTSNTYRNVSYRIENSLRKVFKADDSFVGVQVTELVYGSVIANFDLYMNDNASIVPAKALEIAVNRGFVGGLPVDPKYLRIRQVSCNRALGMESGTIKDEQINASSQSKGHEATQGRLNHAKGWHAEEMNSKVYFQIRFHSNVNITAIATQGDAESSYVTVYKLLYSKDGDDWLNYKGSKNDSLAKNFTGNNDTTSIIKNVLPEPITLVKFIRVIPVSWVNGIGMRTEIYGCISDPVLSPDEIPTTQPSLIVPTKPNVAAVGAKDNEYSWGKYLGITFGLLMVVGCLIAFFIWWRSSKKKQQREKTPLVMTRFQDGEYKVIEKNAEEYDAEDAV